MSDTLQIFSKTRDYVQALVETEELINYKKAVTEFENDSAAKKLLSDYQETQRTYAAFRQGQFEGVEEEKKFMDLEDQLSKNQKIQTLIETQQILQNLVGNLVGNISQGINFPFVQPKKGGCCG